MAGSRTSMISWQPGSPEEPENQSFGGARCSTTSGTTGHPKGVRGSLTNMPEGADPTIWQLIGAGFAEQMGGPGRTVLCGPFYHSAQWAYSFLPMLTGSATVMQHKYDSAGVLRLIDDHQATNNSSRSDTDEAPRGPSQRREGLVRWFVVAPRAARCRSVPTGRQAVDDRLVGPPRSPSTTARPRGR